MYMHQVEHHTLHWALQLWQERVSITAVAELRPAPIEGQRQEASSAESCVDCVGSVGSQPLPCGAANLTMHSETSVDDMHVQTSVDGAQDEIVLDGTHRETSLDDMQGEVVLDGTHGEASVDTTHEESSQNGGGSSLTPQRRHRCPNRLKVGFRMTQV